MARTAIFISYRSLDEAFASGLRDELGTEHEVWIDSQGIPAGAGFRDSIRAAVESCEAMIVVLTGAWLASRECLAELALAASLHKRIIPVEPHRLEKPSLPAGLDGLSPIGFWRAAGRDAALAKLRYDLVADHDWIRAHRDLLVDALRWQRSGEPDLRLRGPALRTAVRMVEQAAAGVRAPDLLPVQRDYVRACEVAEAAEVQRLTMLNRRATARHLLAEAQRAWTADRSNIGLALRLVTESLRRAPGAAARSLANELLRTFPLPLITLDGSQGARQLVFSGDGRFIAFACGPRLQVWTRSGWTRALDRTLDGPAQALRFDSSTLVVLAADGTVRRIPLIGGAETVIGGVDPRRAALSPDGRHLARARRNGPVFVQPTAAPGDPGARFDLPLDARALALSADGRHLLVCAAGTGLDADHLVRLIDTESGATRDLSDQFQMDPVFSPDGRFAAARGATFSTIWRVVDGAAEGKVPGDLAAWYPDSRSAIVRRQWLMRMDGPPASRYELRRWTAGLDDLESVLRLTVNPHPIRVFTFRERTMIAFAAERDVRVVDARFGTATAIVPQSSDLSGPEFAVTARGDLLATASTMDAVRVFDLEPDDDRTIGPFHAGIDMATASPDGRWVAYGLAHADGTDFGSMQAFDRQAGARAATEGKVPCLAVSDEGSFAAVTAPLHRFSGAGREVRGAAALVVAARGVVREWPRAEAGRALAISSDGRWVAEIGADGAARRVDTDDPDAEPVTLAAAGVTEAGFDPSGRYLLASGGGRIRVFDSVAGRAAVDRIACACFDGPDRLWVADVDRLVHLALPGGDEVSAVALPFVPAELRALAPAGRLLAIHEHAVVVLDSGSGEVLARMEHLDPVRSISCSPTRRYVLAATETGRSVVWDTDQAVQVFEIDQPYARVLWLSGDRLAVARGDHLQVEDASHETLLAAAAVRSGMLARQEWQTYLPDEPWPGEAGASH